MSIKGLVEPNEVKAWLGNFPNELTPEQFDRLHKAFQAISDRWPDGDADEQTENAGVAAYEMIIGASSLEAVAHAWRESRRIEREKMAALTGAIIAAAQTMPETQVSAIAGVHRKTVRTALGK